jgi:uncharacterized membrane protein YdbT with pleckstrin-like domain
MAPFPRKLLADHEKIVFDLKPHWVALVAPAAWVVAGVVVLFFGLNWVDNLDEGSFRSAMKYVVSIGSVAAMFYLGVFPALTWATTHFVLTSDRLITRHGIIAKHSREIPLERINDVSFSQSVLERALGAGDLMIESAGERGQSRITNVRKPEDVQLMIYKETEANNNRMMKGDGPSRSQADGPEQPAAPTSAAPAQDNVLQQIEQLARLKDSGAITEMEFESKKQELLKRL